MSRRWQRSAIVAAGALLGVWFFANYEGMRTVDPREYGWVMNGQDIRIEYSGWQAFRIEPWQFPPGRISGLVSPVGTSIANMDSIPMVAIALKPLSARLPPDFQYFGAWHLLCAVLQGAFAALLLSLTGAAWPFVLLGTALFLWNPLAVPMGDNPALAAAGWISLAGLWLYFRPLAASSRRRELAAWMLLGVLAAGINTYVCVMLLSIAAAFFLRRWRPDRALTAVQAGLALTTVLLAVVLVWWLEGYFLVGRYSDLLGGGLGRWSMNLLAPINPVGWSRYLRSIRMATDGQYEGFAYFGLGILLLAQAGVLWLAFRPPSRAELAAAAPVLLACAVLITVAVSPNVTFGPHVLVELPRALYTPFGPFRASGRFVQPAFYLMLFLLLRRVARHLPPWAAIAVAFAVLALQINDLNPTLGQIHHRTANPARYTWRHPLQPEAWRFATDSHQRMIVVPSKAWDRDTRAALIWLAARAGLAINGGEPSRYDQDAAYRADRTLIRQLASDALDPATVYVVHPTDLDAFVAVHRDHLSCVQVEGYNACTAK